MISRRWIGGATGLCLALAGLLPAPALAYNPVGDVVDFTVTDADGNPGMTYYDILNGATTGRGDLDEELLFYLNGIKNRDNLLNWSNLGYEILRNGGGETAYWDHDGKGFDGEFDVGGDYMDLIARWGSSLKIANSFSDVEFAARKRVSDYFVHNDKREVGTSEIEGIPEWEEDDDARVIFYTDAFTADNDAGQRYYNYFGLAFYDFQLALIADEDLHYSTAADGYENIESAVEAGAPGVTYQLTTGAKDGFVSGVSNGDTLPITTTQKVATSQTTTISNSITNSEAYSWSLMLGASLTFGYDAPAPTGGAEFSTTIYNQFTVGGVYTSAYSTTAQNSKTTSNEASISMTLPPHTQALMKQSDVTMAATVNYDSPIVLTYKVAVYSLCGHKYWDGLFTHINYKDSHYLATFGKDNGSGANATDNLATRIKYYNVIPNYEVTFGDNLDWDAIYFDNPSIQAVRAENSVDWLRSHKPMSVTGAKLSVDYQGFQSEIYATQPMYPLARVISGYGEFGMGYGTYRYVMDIPLSGTDASYTPYFGFDKRYGHWILLDAFGNPVSTSPIATLSTDPVTHAPVLTAGTTTGVVYLKYLIDEDQYSFGPQQIFTDNSELTSTAVVKVSVVPSIVGDPRPDAPFKLAGSASGGGWYTLDDGSRVTVSFNVNPVPKSTDFAEYKGHLTLVNEGKWRLSGSTDMYVNNEALGRIYGVGSLDRWDPSLKNGKGGWVRASDRVPFNASLIDADASPLPDSPKGNLAPADMFGIHIDYGAPTSGPALPNSDLMELQGGNIGTRS